MTRRSANLPTPKPATRMRQMKLKVYGWGGHRGVVGSTREIMAAPSAAAVARALGLRAARDVWNLSETANDHSVALAMSKPGMIFWSPADGRSHENREWTMVTPEVPIDVVPKSTKVETTTVTIYKVHVPTRWNDDGPQYPELVSCKARKTANQYIRDRKSDDTSGFAFDFCTNLPFDWVDETPEDAIARFVRKHEDLVVRLHKEADESERLANAAVLLHLVTPK